MGAIMSSSSGQGFTGSIVNGLPNYVLADRSTIGMGDGMTGAIQYVKILWGGSGEANLVSDSASDPSALPVSLNTPENYFLTDALINGMTYTNGVTAFAVKILDAAGLCLGSVSISLGTGFTLEGVRSGLTLGVTFGAITAPAAGIAIKNATIGGVTQALGITGSVYVLGGTVAVSGLDLSSLSFGSGLTIAGISAGVTLPVLFSGGTLDGIANTVGTRIKGIDSGVTLAAVLFSPGGTFLGSGLCGSLLISGVSGATPVGVTFANISISGTPSVSISGTPSVNATISGTPSVSISGTPSVNATISGTPSVSISGTPSVNATISGTPGVTIRPASASTGTAGQAGGGTTFNSVLTNFNGVPIGYDVSGGVATFRGFPVHGVSGATAIPVQIVGGLSGITITGLSFPSSFAVSGGTLAVSGGTLGFVQIGSISGGTVNIGNTVTVGGSVSVSNASLNVNVSNSADTNAIPIKSIADWKDSSGNKLIDHLKGLTVSVSGLNFSGGVTLNGVGITASGLSFGGTALAGFGVTFGSVSLATGTQITLSAASEMEIKGGATSRSSAPVGVTLIGGLPFGITAVGISGATSSTVLGVGLYGKGPSGFVPIGMTGDALNVTIVGGLSGITITGFAFPSSFAVSGGTLAVSGGTLGFVQIGSISGGTVNIGNTVTVGGSVTASISNTRVPVFLSDSSGTAISTANAVPVIGHAGATAVRVVLSDQFGTPIGLSGSTAIGMPVFGIPGATALGVTIAGPISLQGITTGALSGVTSIGVVFANNWGTPLGLSGATVVGMPVFGVSGATAIDVRIVAGTFGVTLNATINNTVTIGSTLGIRITEGVTTGATSGITAIGVVFANNFGVPLGLSGATVVGLPVFGVSGATAIGVTFSGVSIRPVLGSSGIGGLSGGGTTFNTVLTTVAGVPIGYDLTGGAAIFRGFPVHGVSGATAIDVRIMGAGASFMDGISYNNDGDAFIGIWNQITVTGTSESKIGVTFAGSVRLEAQFATGGEAYMRVGTTGGVFVGVTGTVALQTLANGITRGATGIAVLFANNFGVPLGLSGATVVGLPVFGFGLGATAIGVTFGAITFGAAGMGVTFGGITFSTTRTIIVGTSFAGGGSNLGIPVFGVVGSTAVQVSVVGGTVSGIFTTEPGGITVTVVPAGIPVFGVSGATAMGVTFAGSVRVTGGVSLLGTAGVTFGAITGSVNILGTPSVSISGAVSVQNTSGGSLKVEPSSAFSSNKIVSGSTADTGFIVVQKPGVKFARGLTLNADFITVTVPTPGNTAVSINTSPVCVTKNYTGEIDGVINGEISVPLKHGLYVQMTKWDLLSHVYVGYTAASLSEFDRHAQVLYREYQVAPIWGNAMEQFRQFAGKGGNSAAFANNTMADGSNLSANAETHPVQKQFVGVIEKPTRIFIPCRNAGEVYIKVVGDYTNHTIGSGFWNFEGATAEWSAHTLYERGFYASNMSGINNYIAGDASGGNPDLDANGNVTGVFAVQGTTNDSIAIQKILDSYQNNPFIRIWGH
jgi:hypothetical protein